MNALIVNDKGEIGVFEMPVEPNHFDYKYQNEFKEWLWKSDGHKFQYADDWDKYQSALKQASENPVRCKDQEQAIELLYRDNPSPFDGGFPVIDPGVYPIPNLTFEVVEHCQHDACPTDGDCDHCKEPIPLAILSLTTEPEKEVVLSEQYPNELAARAAVKNDDIAMFASDEDLLIYEHFFHKGIEFATRKEGEEQKEESQETFWSETGRLLWEYRQEGNEERANGIVDARILYNRFHP